MNLFKDEGEKGKQEREPAVVPLPKPPRQAPEVKSKPQLYAPAPLTVSNSNPTASVHREEEEEDNKFMKELQVCLIICCFFELKQIK